MKAKEFIQAHGFSKVADIVAKYSKTHTHVTDDARMFISKEDAEKWQHESIDSCVTMVELKEYVDAWGLVQKHGGLVNAKYDAEHLYINWDYRTMMEDALKKAIQLVESINESN